MNRSSIEQRLRMVFERSFGRPFVGSDHSVQSVEEWDSLSHVKLVLNLEKEFDLIIDPDAMAELFDSFHRIQRFLEYSLSRAH
jgi:acyl carrier protein